MTKIKLCGMRRVEDIEVVNELHPDYVGFILYFPKSKRNIEPETAALLKSKLNKDIKAVGVFVNADIEKVARLLDEGIIDVAQLHGDEDEVYIKGLKEMTGKPVFKAFKIKTIVDINSANTCLADEVLLDSGTGSGEVFDWNLLKEMKRSYFLAGGLNCDNIESALDTLKPYGVDVSSGIETDGYKDKEKMKKFVYAVRNA